MHGLRPWQMAYREMDALLPVSSYITVYHPPNCSLQNRQAADVTVGKTQMLQCPVPEVGRVLAKASQPLATFTSSVSIHSMPINEALEPLKTRICLHLKHKFENNRESLLSPSERSAEPFCSLRDWPSSAAVVEVAFLEPGQSWGRSS